MRAVMLEVPEELLEDRRRRGLDKRDEVWAGVLHMVPTPSSPHQRFSRDLLFVLARIGAARGLEPLFELNLLDPVQGWQDYRVPDLVLVASEHVSTRGIEGRATLVVEILSPNDESREKLPFYARVGVREVWIVDPKTRAIEVFTLRDGVFVPLEGAVIQSPALGVMLETVDGKLQIDGDAV